MILDSLTPTLTGRGERMRASGPVERDVRRLGETADRIAFGARSSALAHVAGRPSRMWNGEAVGITESSVNPPAVKIAAHSS